MYVGEKYNANTGLYYLRARYMNPSTGSFTTMDSYQGSLYEPISLHKYAYANANPVSNIDPSGYFSIAECTVVQTIRSNINEIVQIQALRKIMTWANVACTTYDVCVTLREVFLHDASSLAIFDSILKGMVIDQLVNCLLGGHLKIIAKAIMACKGLGDQVDTIKADIERGDPVAAGFHALQLITMIFSIMAQCFTGETLVATDEGLVAIEDIEVGDYVLAEDTVTGEQEYKEVLNVFVSQTNKLVHVTTADKNSETNTETIINTTDNHPFYVEGKGWVPAIELEAGDVLRTVDGDVEIVSKVDIEYLDEPVLIYNLEVEGYHTYFVSDESVLVHNITQSGCGPNNNLNEQKNKLMSDKTLTNQTGKVDNYVSSTKGNVAAQSDFDSMNPSNVRTYPNGTVVGDLPDGTTINLHPSTSLKGVISLEIYDPVSGHSIKIRY